MSWTDDLLQVGSYIRDVEVARVSGDGTQTTGTRAESIPDQTTMNRSDMSGPVPTVAGVGISPNMLILAALGVAAVVVAVRGAG